MLKIKKQPMIKDFKNYELIYDEQGELKTDLVLLQALKTWRAAIMKKENLPSTYIFYNKTLVLFATYFPQTEEAFIGTYGAGKRKWQKYGGAIVGIIKEHLINMEYGKDDTIPF